MKPRKRFAALLLSLALTLSLVSVSLAAEQKAEVTGNCVRVHVEAEMDSECYDQVNKGEVLTVVERADENGWVKVRFTYSGTGEEKEGYVSADYLKLKEAKTEQKKDASKGEQKSEQKDAAKSEQKSEQKDAAKSEQKSEQKDAAKSEQKDTAKSEQKKDTDEGGARAPSMMADSNVEVESYSGGKQGAREETKRAAEPEPEESAGTPVEPDAEESTGTPVEPDASVSAPEAVEDSSAEAEQPDAAAAQEQTDAAGADASAGVVALPEEEEEEDPDISPKVSYTATVNDEGINLRREPSLEAEILTQVPEGDIVIIRSEEDEEGWMKVLYYDSEGTKFKGYMMGEYLDINAIGVGRSNVPSVIIRQEPDTASVICGVVPKGKKVDVFVNRENWYRIEYKDMSGWVQAECITVEGESDCEGYCLVKQESLNLREAPDLESAKLEKIPAGIVLQVTDKTEDGKWYVVTYNGHTGYVSTEYVEDVDGCTEGYVQTTTSSLSLRTGAGSSFARLTTIPQGQVLPVSGTVGDWYEVKYGKFTGYVSGAFVSVTTEDGFRAYPDYVEIRADEVAVRAEPTEESEQLETLEKGTLLAIQGIRDGWYMITYNGQTGYVNGEQAERGTDAANQAAEQAAAAIEAGGEAMMQSNGNGSSILEYATQFIGNPNLGGTSLTNGADCSGFVKSILAHFGIDVPHSSASIRGCGRSVSESEMQPGDIVCYSGHVGIYAGNGRLLSALGKKYGITYNSVHYKQILSVRRFT